MTKKLLSTYRKTKSEIPLLENEIAYMQQGDNGFDNSIILDCRTGEPRRRRWLASTGSGMPGGSRTLKRKKPGVWLWKIGLMA